MQIIKGDYNSSPLYTFIDIDRNNPKEILEELKNIGIYEFDENDIENSIYLWKNDYKFALNKNGWVMYHPCGHNKLRLEFFFDTTYNSYIV